VRDGRLDSPGYRKSRKASGLDRHCCCYYHRCCGSSHPLERTSWEYSWVLTLAVKTVLNDNTAELAPWAMHYVLVKLALLARPRPRHAWPETMSIMLYTCWLVPSCILSRRSTARLQAIPDNSEQQRQGFQHRHIQRTAYPYTAITPQQHISGA